RAPPGQPLPRIVFLFPLGIKMFAFGGEDMFETFGRYELLKKMAKGGMGEVFLARQQGVHGFEKLLVVKKILAHHNEEEEFIKMFLDEARIAAGLNHPNIAQIFDLGEQDGSYYLAMAYVQGEDVRRISRFC